MSNKLNNLAQKAQQLMSQGQQTEAMGVYEQICKLAKDNAGAWMALGAVAGNLGKLDRSCEAFRKAAELTPSFSQPHEYLLQALEMNSRHSEAITLLKQFEQSALAPADIKMRLGVMYGKAGDFSNALPYLEECAIAQPANAYIQHCLASTHESLDNLEASSSHYQKAISLAPQDNKLINDYGAMLQKSGDLEAAISQYQRSLGIDNNFALAHYNLGSVYNLTGEFKLAISHFTTALQLQNDYFEAMVGIANSHRALGNKRESIAMYRNALSIKPGDTDLVVDLAYSLISNGEYEEAQQRLEDALKDKHNNIALGCAAIITYERRGQFEKATPILHALLESGAKDKDIALAYGSMCKEMNECDQAIDYIETVLNEQSLDPMAKTLVHFKAGNILDKMKKFDDAFRHFSSANGLLPYEYDHDAILRSLANFKSIFTNDSIRNNRNLTSGAPRPVFILGMPRSGTTLVEQILGSHSQVFAAGEIPHLSDLAFKTWGEFATENYLDPAATLPDAFNLKQMADEYISLASSGSSLPVVTDKMPHNFRLIGFINMLFPNARIIHCTRDPRDNCLSIYFSNFNANHAYATDTSELARYYKEFYIPLMEYWDQTSVIPIHHVSYTDMIHDQESTTRSLLEYCELEWDDAVLEFHKSDRDVATISYDQVRQPIYKSSLARWKNYQEHVKPLTDAFGID